MPIKLNTASGGGVTLQGENTAADVTVTVPATDGGTAVVSNADGNVGLGVIPSAWGSYNGTIDLKGGGGLGAFNNSTALFSNSYYNGSNYIYKASTSAGFYQIAGAVHQWYTAPSGTAGNAITFTQVMQIAQDGQQSSVIPGGSTLYPEYKCRAWVNFNGTGAPAIYSSGNVSSITDNGTGLYSVNFATAMPDTDYAVISTGQGSGSFSGLLSLIGTATKTTTSVGSFLNRTVGASSTAVLEAPQLSVAIFR